MTVADTMRCNWRDDAALALRAADWTAFEALRPTPTTPSGKTGEPSYMPLIGPMVLFVACQGLV